LRGIGVTLVILYHVCPWENYPRAVYLLLNLPWMTMDAFFVLSGFLIAGILLDTRTRPDYYPAFYTRRALRILPLYYAFLLIYAALMWLWKGHASYTAMLANWGSPWWFFVYLGNIPTAITGRWPAGSLGPLWSLQIEEQFYLLFPLLVQRLSLKSLTRVLFALCCFSTVLRLLLYWLYPTNEVIEYVLLPCRMEGLAMGAWLAIRFRQGPWPVNRKRLTVMVVCSLIVTVGSAAWSGFFMTTPFNRTIGFLLSPICCTFIIFWLIQLRGSRTTAALRIPSLQYIGKVSYAAYLFHVPVSNLVTTNNAIGRPLIIYALTFGFSALSWHFFEKPIASLARPNDILKFPAAVADSEGCQSLIRNS
jgi:peptidoglycan/LPS O-acetylase OafA/YrhL